MIKMAVFDLDGTLVDSLTDLAISVNKGLKAVGLPEHPVDSYRKFVGNGRQKLVERAMGDFSDREKFNSVMEIFNSEYAAHCNDNTSAYEGCDVLLNCLDEKGIMTAVLSNKPDEFVGAILSKLYPAHSFDEAWGQKPQYRCKPDGEALHAILSLHGVKPGECVYIGDSDVDVFTARNAGVKMAGVSWGFRGKKELLEAGAPFVADTAEELLWYILSL